MLRLRLALCGRSSASAISDGFDFDVFSLLLGWLLAFGLWWAGR